MKWTFPYESRSQIRALLEENSLGMSKKFGQNFLLTQSVREKIVSSIGLKAGDSVWEVGPGIGNITTILLEKGALVTAFEIDRGFISILKEQAFVDVPAFNLVEGDMLKNFKDVVREKGAPDVICGNLPYNVGSIIIARVLEERVGAPTMVFTLQKEVVDRIVGMHGTKNWSTLSILCQVDYHVTSLFTIKATHFYPHPTVDSSVIHFKKREASLVPDDVRELFFIIVHDLFASRRKTMRNNLLNNRLSTIIPQSVIDEIIASSRFDPLTRGEVFSIEDLIELSRLFKYYSTHQSKDLSYIDKN
jgi:16S rRNA (adenine1518-N6/adenine1519-N6)-dimethyltransferase